MEGRADLPAFLQSLGPRAVMGTASNPGWLFPTAWDTLVAIKLDTRIGVQEGMQYMWHRLQSTYCQPPLVFHGETSLTEDVELPASCLQPANRVH